MTTTRKILSALLALTLVATAFTACSSDDITTGLKPEQPVDNKTVSFTVSLDQQTRLAFIDENNEIKTHWDYRDDGETMIFKSTSDSEEYGFVIGGISADGLTATITYDGNNGDFPDPFYGTITYEIDAIAQRQAANGTEGAADATAHLHYGTKLEADYSHDGLSVGENPSISLHHVGTSFFRVALKAPVDIIQPNPDATVAHGAELAVKANGKQIGKVKFDFGVAEGEPLVAYVRCTTQPNATNMVYTIIQGDDTYSYASTFSSSHNLEGGKYYYTDLKTKTPTHNSKHVYDAIGGAPADVQPIDLNIKIDEDDEYEP